MADQEGIVRSPTNRLTHFADELQHSYASQASYYGSCDSSYEGDMSTRPQRTICERIQLTCGAIRVAFQRFLAVEIYLVLFVLAGYPSYPLKEQYFYYAVGKSMDIDVRNLSYHGNETCGVYPNDTAYQEREQVQAKTAEISMYIQLAYFIPAMLSMLIYGGYSDKIGRRLLFILPPLGCAMEAGLTMAIIHFELPLWTFYISPVFNVFFGGPSVVYTAIYSYIADTTLWNKRVIRMIIIDMLRGLLGGFVQLAIGYWIRKSYFYPYCLVIGVYFLTFFYALFVIPESLFQQSPARLLKDMCKAIALYVKDNGRKRRWKLWILQLAMIVEILFMSTSVFTLYEMNNPLCWDSVFIGYYGAIVNTVKAVGGIPGALMRRYMEDHWLALLGKLSMAVEFMYLAFVETSLMMYFGE